MLPDPDKACRVALQKKQEVKAMQTLQGLLMGLMADDTLNDREIQFLSTWLAENREVARVWPGSAIYQHVREALADGIITDEERTRLQQVAGQIIGGSFAETGSTAPDTAGVPFDLGAPASIAEQRICLTGEFIYGTRSECQRVSEKRGAVCVSAVSSRLHYLVVGTNISPHWVSTSYGRKIQTAMQLKAEGRGPFIISEQHWLRALEAQ